VSTWRTNWVEGINKVMKILVKPLYELRQHFGKTLVNILHIYFSKDSLPCSLSAFNPRNGSPYCWFPPGCSPPVVPCFKAEYQQQETLSRLHYTDTTELKSILASSTFARRNGFDLGSLLREFFKFYNGFDFNCVISVRSGSKLIKTEKWSKEICIEEPFDRSNTARALQNYNFSTIKKRFAKAMTDLEQKPRISALVRVQ
jgi:hypothetical protein